MRLVALLLVSAACGRVSGEGEPDAMPQIDADPGTYALSIADTDVSGFRGSAIRIPFRIDRSGGFQGDVALELVSPPSGFAGTFAPNPVPAGTEDVVVTVQTPRVIGANPTALQVQATAAVGNHTLDLSLTLNSLDISGKVLTPTGSLPTTGTVVSIPGTGQATVAANGTFTIPGSHVPYDMIISVPGVTGRTMYVGLTRPDPLVRDFTWFGLPFPPMPLRSAAIDLTLTGVLAGECNSTNTKMWLALPAGRTEPVFNVPTFGTSCKVTGTLSWAGDLPTTITPAFNVLVGVPGGPFRDASSSPTFVDGNATAVTFSLNPAAIADGPLQGVVGIPPGATALTLFVGLESGRYDTAELFRTMNSGEAVFPKTVPILPNLSYQVSLRVTVASGSEAHLSRDGLTHGVANDFVLPPPSDPLTPANLATNVDDGTVFTWSPHTGTSTYKITAQDATYCNPPFMAQECTESRLTVFTQATSTTLPVNGAALPAGSYDWQVEASSPTTIDQTADMVTGFIDGRDNSTYSSSSANRLRFTFKL